MDKDDKDITTNLSDAELRALGFPVRKRKRSRARRDAATAAEDRARQTKPDKDASPDWWG